MSYKLLKQGVKRLADGACIPPFDDNLDWARYQEWLAQGNTPEPLDPDPVPDPRLVLDASEQVTAKANAPMMAFLNMTKAQSDAWIDANVADAGTRVALKVLGSIAKHAARGRMLR